MRNPERNHVAPAGATIASSLTIHSSMRRSTHINKIRAVDRFAVTQIAKGVRAALSKETPARESAGVEM